MQIEIDQRTNTINNGTAPNWFTDAGLDAEAELE